MVIGVVRNQNTVTGVIISNKSGSQAVMGGGIDKTSGDTDCAVLAGENFETDGERVLISLMFTIGNAV